jgi:branched-chain amino acid aminotransferase
MIVGKKIMHNGQIVPAPESMPESQSVKIYEVIRVIEGVCLFLEDHLARLVNSARLAGEPLPATDQQFAQMMKELVEANMNKEGNIQLTVSFSGREADYHAHYIPHYYPSKDQYNNGISVKALKKERPNPNAKILHQEIKKEVEVILTDKNIYEVILVDNDGFLTEGSKSNLFFIQEAKVITAPFQRILPGVTRKYILQSCIKLKLDIEERCLHYKELPAVQGAFISGTSPKALPVSKFDTYSIPADNAMMRDIMNCYDSIITEYIEKNK